LKKLHWMGYCQRNRFMLDKRDKMLDELNDLKNRDQFSISEVSYFTGIPKQEIAYKIQMDDFDVFGYDGKYFVHRNNVVDLLETQGYHEAT
jgi:hypothetical protein